MVRHAGRGLYGLLWWFNGQSPAATERLWPHVQPDVYAAISGGAHSVVVYPSLNIVAAARNATWGSDEDLTRSQNLKLLSDKKSF